MFKIWRNFQKQIFNATCVLILFTATFKIFNDEWLELDTAENKSNTTPMMITDNVIVEILCNESIFQFFLHIIQTFVLFLEIIMLNHFLSKFHILRCKWNEIVRLRVNKRQIRFA